MDICNLDRIKYDFVGSFENFSADVKSVVDRFGGEHMEMFTAGKESHFTNADSKLASLYDQVSE